MYVGWDKKLKINFAWPNNHHIKIIVVRPSVRYGRSAETI